MKKPVRYATVDWAVLRECGHEQFFVVVGVLHRSRGESKLPTTRLERTETSRYKLTRRLFMSGFKMYSSVPSVSSKRYF